MNQIQDILPIKDWDSRLKDDHLFIAGPCSAESEDQVLTTVREIAKVECVHAIRAGIWKPRTRPGSFEGVGEKGLEWLSKAKAETGLMIATEVAYPNHVEKCLKHDVDIMWIGARTASNPFSVQEIASALAGTDQIVMVKNPLNPDLDLWIGAIERLYKSGIRKIAAVHRGFYPFEKTKLRNIPKWELVIELKRNFPELPIIGDPSHIAGKTDYIFDISQKALDLNYNGLMIESHYNPKIAKSDAAQQITPEELDRLFKELKIRHEAPENRKQLDTLEQFREQIDSIDGQLLELLAQRIKVVKNIGDYKHENNLSIFQLKRWENIISTRLKMGNNMGLPEDYLMQLLQIIHKMSIDLQTKTEK